MNRADIDALLDLLLRPEQARARDEIGLRGPEFAPLLQLEYLPAVLGRIEARWDEFADATGRREQLWRLVQYLAEPYEADQERPPPRLDEDALTIREVFALFKTLKTTTVPAGGRGLWDVEAWLGPAGPADPDEQSLVHDEMVAVLGGPQIVEQEQELAAWLVGWSHFGTSPLQWFDATRALALFAKRVAERSGSALMPLAPEHENDEENCLQWDEMVAEITTCARCRRPLADCYVQWLVRLATERPLLFERLEAQPDEDENLLRLTLDRSKPQDRDNYYAHRWRLTYEGHQGRPGSLGEQERQSWRAPPQEPVRTYGLAEGAAVYDTELREPAVPHRPSKFQASPYELWLGDRGQQASEQVRVIDELAEIERQLACALETGAPRAKAEGGSFEEFDAWFRALHLASDATLKAQNIRQVRAGLQSWQASFDDLDRLVRLALATSILRSLDEAMILAGHLMVLAARIASEQPRLRRIIAALAYLVRPTAEQEPETERELGDQVASVCYLLFRSRHFGFAADLLYPAAVRHKVEDLATLSAALMEQIASEGPEHERAMELVGINLPCVGARVGFGVLSEPLIKSNEPAVLAIREAVFRQPGGLLRLQGTEIRPRHELIEAFKLGEAASLDDDGDVILMEHYRQRQARLAHDRQHRGKVRETLRARRKQMVAVG